MIQVSDTCQYTAILNPALIKTSNQTLTDMIIYGVRTNQLAKELSHDQCSNCGTQGSLELYVFQKYAHVFWIPFFPVKKTCVSQCNHCKQVLKLKEMPASLKLTYENLKSNAKTPIWTFAGLAIVAILIIGVFINEKKKTERTGRLILTPRSGDVFEIKTTEGQFTLYKVEGVEGDSVFIRPNKYETNLETGLDDIKYKGDSSYVEDVFSFSKSELKQMVDKEEIIDIDRK